jgi:hypothetical protein
MPLGARAVQFPPTSRHDPARFLGALKPILHQPRGADLQTRRASGAGSANFRKFDPGPVRPEPDDQFLSRSARRARRQAASPNQCHTPTRLLKRLGLPLVATSVLSKLGEPILAMRGRNSRVPAALMAVPEAAMHEHDGAVFWEHKIGTPRQRPGMEAVAQSSSVEKASEPQLRRGIRLAHARHHPRARSGIDDVRHSGSTG